MKQIFVAVISLIFTSLSFSQVINADSGSVSDAVQSLFQLNQPKLGFMAQFAGEMSDDGHNTTSAFTIRNLRMYFTGSVGEHFKYFFQGSLNQSFEMLDLKLSYILDEHLRIDAGRFKTGFGEEYLVNDAKLLFVKRSTIALGVGTFRKYGVQMQSSVLEKRVTLTVGAFNGEYAHPKKVSLFIGKLSTIPIKSDELLPDFQFEAGGSIAYTGNRDDLPYLFVRNDYILYNMSARLTYKKLWLAGEYFSATSNRTKTLDGFYTDMGAKIQSDLEVIGRFDWSSAYFKEVFDDPLWQYVYSQDVTRKYLVGVNYYPLDHIKVQLDYERDDTHRINSAWLNFQYAINFE